VIRAKLIAILTDAKRNGEDQNERKIIGSTCGRYNAFMRAEIVKPY